MINGASTVPPRSDVEEERACELAFKFGKDAAGLVLEMGAAVHVGQNGV